MSSTTLWAEGLSDPQADVSTGALRLGGILLLLAVGLSAQASSEAYTPSNDATVVAVLPTSMAIPQLAAMRAAARSNPENPVAASDLAAAYLQFARQYSDARGYSLALQSLSTAKAAHPDALELSLLQARALRGLHEYSQALFILDETVHRHPESGQAWLDRANLLHLLGRFQQSEQSCRPLLVSASSLIARTCLAQARGGYLPPAESYRELLPIWQRHQYRAAPGIRIWSLHVLAELAERSGNADAAKRHLLTALDLDETDRETRLALDSLHLREKRSNAVYSQISYTSKSGIDSATWIRALAANPGDTAAQSQLNRYFAGLSRRGPIHERSYLEYLFWVLDAPPKTADVAAAVFAQQKGAEDIWLAYRSAVRTNNPSLKARIEGWMQQTGYQDARLRDEQL